MGLAWGPISLLAQEKKPDPIGDGLREAYKLHQKGDAEALAAKLRDVLKAVEAAGAKKLASRLPDMLGDWKAEAVKVEDLGVAGGGMSLARVYVNADKRAEVKVVKDSPMLKHLLPLLANEELLKLGGRKIERVDGKVAVYDGERKLQMALGDSIYFEVAGSEKCTSADVAGIARKLDLRALARIEKPVKPGGGAAE